MHFFYYQGNGCWLLTMSWTAMKKVTGSMRKTMNTPAMVEWRHTIVGGGSGKTVGYMMGGKSWWWWVPLHCQEHIKGMSDVLLFCIKSNTEAALFMNDQVLSFHRYKQMCLHKSKFWTPHNRHVAYASGCSASPCKHIVIVVSLWCHIVIYDHLFSQIPNHPYIFEKNRSDTIDGVDSKKHHSFTLENKVNIIKWTKRGGHGVSCSVVWTVIKDR